MSDTYTHLLYHIVFSTKHRAPIITDRIRERLYEYIGGIIRAEGGSLLEIGGMEDHVHLLARLKPTLAIAEAARLIKANSSKWLNESVVSDSFRWQAGYGAFTVGKSMVTDVSRYIRNQADHYRKRTFQEELIELLQLNGIDYDKDRIWA
jgi:REP element-mobilizing transposase RayT